MRRTLAALLAAGALVAVAAVTAVAAPAAPAVTPDEASALGREAYLYGFPLLEFLRVRATVTSVPCPDDRGHAPVNTFSNAAHFATPKNRTSSAPNVDTLYSIAELDLGHGPVVLSHPDMGRRYFVFELVDPYTNVAGYVGARTTGSRAGRFAITWAGHPGRRVPGATVVRSSARRLWVIGRTAAGGPADQRRALGLMRRYRLAPPGGPRRFPAGCRPGTPREASTPAGLAFLDALGTALRENPPPARDRPLLERLAAVGVGPGLRPQAAGLPADVLAGLVSGADSTAAALPTLANQTFVQGAAANHGWAIPAKAIGDYGTDYTYRAGVAVLGLGANTRPEAVYPTALGDATGAPLDGNASYRIVFAHDPPAHAFWSLTVYGGDNFLVANAIDRYAIGPTHRGLVRRRDGSVVVVLARTRPTEAGVNWLPTPPGPMRLNLRIYWPLRSVISGAWAPPPVMRTGARRTPLGA